MRKKLIVAGCAVALIGTAALLAGTAGEAADWAMNATIGRVGPPPLFSRSR